MSDSKMNENESLHDITLKGNDGVPVSANRMVLAARSKVFERMLVGGFSEANSPAIELPYKGSVLQAVVQYIHTDSADIFKSTEEDSKGDFPLLLVSLAAAAKYYDLQGLSQKVADKLSQMLDMKPSMAFFLLQLCHQEGPIIPDMISKVAMSCLRNNLKGISINNTEAVVSLDASVLVTILQDDELMMTELDLFNMLCSWMQTNLAERKVNAMELVKQHIRLEKIEPQSLSTVVASSQLVTTEQLFDVYKNQAMSYHEVHPECFGKARSLPVWRKSKSYTSNTSITAASVHDVLECSPMCCGSSHEWTVEIMGGVGTYVGIVETNSFREENRGSVVFDGWVLSHKGNAFEKGVEVGPPQPVPFHGGDKLRFTLNLIRGVSGNGTLSYCKADSSGGCSRVQLFSNLLDQLPANNGGFLPAATVSYNSCVRLLEIKKLSS